MALVFQYGSNAHSERLNSSDRLQGDARAVDIAYTDDDYELEFTVSSINNKCAAADIVSGSGRKIWGVLYEIPDYLIRRETSGCRKSLDAIEGEGTNYKRIGIALRYQNGILVEGNSITYVVINKTEGLKTSLEYGRHIVIGLREHKVPNEYVEYVKARIISNNPALKKDIEVL
jgi:hypothetical protein